MVKSSSKGGMLGYFFQHLKDGALDYAFCNYDSHKRHMRNVNGGCAPCGKGPTSIFDIQGSSRVRGSLTTPLFNYKEVLKAAPISAVMVEEEGKALRASQCHHLGSMLLNYISFVELLVISWDGDQGVYWDDVFVLNVLRCHGALLSLCIVHFC